MEDIRGHQRLRGGGNVSDVADQADRSLQYRGSIKHKRWHPGGGYGTLCPNWTHQTLTQGFAGDSYSYPWEETQAHVMLAQSVLAEDGRRYATGRGIAFVAIYSGDSTWHGYPLPWKNVPRNIRNRFVQEGRVTRRETRQTANQTGIRWALGVGN